MKVLICFLICAFSYGQNSTTKCDLRIANDKWIEKFDKASSNTEKVNLVKLKIKSDSIFQENNDPDLYCDYKANFILSYTKRKRLSLYLTNENNRSELIQKIDSTNITSIDLIKMPYWKRGFYCSEPTPIPRVIIISLKTDSKELKKDIKKVLHHRL